MTTPTVRNATLHSAVVIAPIDSIRRYRAKITSATIASEITCVSSDVMPGAMKPRYWTIPITPVDMISGIVNIAVQTKRNGIRRPVRYWKPSRR